MIYATYKCVCVFVYFFYVVIFVIFMRNFCTKNTVIILPDYTMLAREREEKIKCENLSHVFLLILGVFLTKGWLASSQF